MPRPPLTEKQRLVYEFYVAYIGRHGHSPTYQEVADHFGYSSLAKVYEHVDSLVKKRYLARGYNQQQSVELLDDGDIAELCEANDWNIPEKAKYVPVRALPGLFTAWRNRRQDPAT